jgi:hypothetical protein
MSAIATASSVTPISPARMASFVTGSRHVCVASGWSCVDGHLPPRVHVFLEAD